MHLQAGIVALIAATLFLRTHLHPNSIAEGQLYSGFLFFSLLQMFFSGIAEMTFAVIHSFIVCSSSCVLTCTCHSTNLALLQFCRSPMMPAYTNLTLYLCCAKSYLSVVQTSRLLCGTRPCTPHLPYPTVILLYSVMLHAHPIQH